MHVSLYFKNRMYKRHTIACCNAYIHTNMFTFTLALMFELTLDDGLLKLLMNIKDCLLNLNCC